MSVQDITSKAEFDALLKTSPYVALQATATWCGPCKAISPIYNKLAESNKDAAAAKFVRFDIDADSDLTQELGIRSVPAFFFFENGEKVDSVVGANPPALQKAVGALVEKASA
ncbi:thioredoxin-like protein [Emericellopsis atlantica]|uniref:Thioredoxin n=1 Tax=Emericellopsis atlantica TaxID=2614577 RepID=A0A9P8CKM5_9HYPO|nr:thioredoxin-like protein [Emericellopsis atlantica]KAG9250724.1 thioredoxin-like protein [Emericellopsis atlantica]